MSTQQKKKLKRKIASKPHHSSRTTSLYLLQNMFQRWIHLDELVTGKNEGSGGSEEAKERCGFVAAEGSYFVFVWRETEIYCGFVAAELMQKKRTIYIFYLGQSGGKERWCRPLTPSLILPTNTNLKPIN